MEIIIYYGPTGSGKSYSAHTNWPDAYNMVWPEAGGWWWPNYNGEETVIADDFSHQIKYTRMKELTDRHAMTVQYKGGQVKFRSKRLIITTVIPPHRWYPNVTNVDELRRRIKEFAKIYRFEEANWVFGDTPTPRVIEETLQEREYLNFSTPVGSYGSYQ